MFTEENGSGTFYFVYTDHLGSITAVTNANGNLIARQNFDAWGRRRKVQDYGHLPQNTTSTDNGLNNNSTLPKWLYRGYTGHEHLDEFALINMNARLYDPVVGQFLSPDNYIQAPGNTQNYNRYAYCLNNPLKYTDPSGNVFIADDIAAGLIGMGINLISQGVAGNITSWQSCLGYATVGFGSGIAGYYGTPIAGGAVAGFGNNFVAQMETNGWEFSSLSKINYSSFAQVGVTSMAFSAVTWGLGTAITPGITPLVSKISSSPVIQMALIQGGTGIVTGGFGSGLGSMMSGANLSTTLSATGEGAIWGFSLGLFTGSISGLRYSKQAGLNPWTGESIRISLDPIEGLPWTKIQDYDKNLYEVKSKDIVVIHDKTDRFHQLDFSNLPEKIYFKQTEVKQIDGCTRYYWQSVKSENNGRHNGKWEILLESDLFQTNHTYFRKFK